MLKLKVKYPFTPNVIFRNPFQRKLACPKIYTSKFLTLTYHFLQRKLKTKVPINAKGHLLYGSIYTVSRTGQSSETECRSVVACSFGEESGETGEVMAEGCRGFFLV